MSIYKQYCNEIVDENGRLQKLTLEYPDNFNFGYDVVNKIAETATDYSDRPLQPQVMKTVTVETFGVDYPEPEKC